MRFEVPFYPSVQQCYRPDVRNDGIFLCEKDDKNTHMYICISGDVCIHQTDDAIIVPCDVMSATANNYSKPYLDVCISLKMCGTRLKEDTVVASCFRI